MIRKLFTLAFISPLAFAIAAHAYEEELLFENAEVAVYKWQLMPNENVGQHRDENPQLVIALKGGELMRIGADGNTSKIVLREGKALFQERDAELHDALNISENPIEAIGIELKKSAAHVGKD